MNTQPSSRRKKASATAKASKDNRQLPVSRKFYAKLRQRGEDIFNSLGYCRAEMSQLQSIIDRYLLEGKQPSRTTTEEHHLIIFTCLRHEIDSAIERSARAKAREAERRERKEAENASIAELHDPTSQENAMETTVSTPHVDCDCTDRAIPDIDGKPPLISPHGEFTQ